MKWPQAKEVIRKTSSKRNIYLYWPNWKHESLNLNFYSGVKKKEDGSQRYYHPMNNQGWTNCCKRTNGIGLDLQTLLLRANLFGSTRPNHWNGQTGILSNQTIMEAMKTVCVPGPHITWNGMMPIANGIIVLGIKFMLCVNTLLNTLKQRPLWQLLKQHLLHLLKQLLLLHPIQHPQYKVFKISWAKHMVRNKRVIKGVCNKKWTGRSNTKFLSILGLLRPTIYQINGNWMRI